MSDPMTAADDTRTEIAAVLAEHVLSRHFNGFPALTPCRCSCGLTTACGTFQSWEICDEAHRHHVATVLAEYVATKQAEAWDLGHGTTCDGITSSLDGCERHNPYRADRIVP